MPWTLLRGIDAAGGFHMGLFENGLVGGVICWNIHPHHRSSEVGYWLASSVTGKGSRDGGGRAGRDDLFRNRDVHRIEMLTAEANLRSRAVCERLSFRLESMRRGSHRFPAGFNDHLVYATARVGSRPGRSAAPDPDRERIPRAARGPRRRLADARLQARRLRVHGRRALRRSTRYSLQGRDALRGFFEDDDDMEQRVEWHHVVFDPARQVGGGRVFVRRHASLPRHGDDQARAWAGSRAGVNTSTSIPAPGTTSRAGRAFERRARGRARARRCSAANSLLCRAAIGAARSIPRRSRSSVSFPAPRCSSCSRAA
jgi:hypothetical protein